jgi:hypothetical protein
MRSRRTELKTVCIVCNFDKQYAIYMNRLIEFNSKICRRITNITFKMYILLNKFLAS